MVNPIIVSGQIRPVNYEETQALLRWENPLPLQLVPDSDPSSFLKYKPEEGFTVIPLLPEHPGAFAFRRKNHIHEGTDLYCPEGTPVMAVEHGRIVNIIEFTGPKAEPPSPHWLPTKAALVEGASGVVVYGEINPLENGKIEIGKSVVAGQMIGRVTRVLIKDKGRPMTMLHLELHTHGARDAFEWAVMGDRPPSLRDPTFGLISASRKPVLRLA